MINERFERLKYENDQRRELECWIHKLPDFLADFLIDAPFEYADKIHKDIGVDVFDALHLALKQQEIPGFSDVSYWDFDSRARLVDAFLAEANLLEGTYWLRLGEGPFCKLGSDQCRYLVKGFGRHMRTIELVAEDMCSGMFTAEYTGYLPAERRTNTDEIVYELLSWQR